MLPVFGSSGSSMDFPGRRARNSRGRTMSHFVLLYVDQPAASARFYATLLGREPVESSPTFAMFALDDGLMLGLWARQGVEPRPAAGPGASELAFVLPSDAEVDAAHSRWTAQGITIAQPPV